MRGSSNLTVADGSSINGNAALASSPASLSPLGSSSICQGDESTLNR